MPPRSYDSTVARMAGNILSGQNLVMVGSNVEHYAVIAVAAARAILEEVKRTEPDYAELYKTVRPTT